MSRYLILGLAILPVAAAAHPGDHGDVPVTHGLTSPDHLSVLALLALVTLGLKTLLEIRHADQLAATRRH